MSKGSLASLISAIAVALTAIFAVAVPAHAVTPEEKLAAMLRFSQPTSSSFGEFNGALQNQGDWADYAFDWSTDLCSNSPDQPLGFDFRPSCTRHDFGYRNYKAMSQFDANKARIDDSFYFDMKQVCAGYSGVPKGTCDGLAWTYYQAVKQFGDLVVSEAQVKQVQRSAVRSAQAERG
jgi:hypothetical protein